MNLRHLAAVPVLGLALSVTAPLHSGSPAILVVCTNGKPASWDRAMGTIVHGDTAASVSLPGGKRLWAFADTTRIDGMPLFVHNSFVVQSGGCLDALPGRHGSWQQIPNWPDGDYFWPNALLHQHGKVYVFGERERPNGRKFPRTIASAIATFNATTLAYEKIDVLPTADVWGDPAPGIRHGISGYWLIGTRGVRRCSDFTGCKVGDTAFIPSGDELNYHHWAVTRGTIRPAADIGTTVSLLRHGRSYVAFTKRADAGTNYIETLIPATAAGPAGRWKVIARYLAPSPRGTDSYSVHVHPEQSAPNGKVLLTYSVNKIEADYHPLFLDVNSGGS